MPTWMDHSLKVLRTIEMLLLLQKMYIGNHWYTPSCLAMSRIWERNAFIACEVRTVVGSLRNLLNTR